MLSQPHLRRRRMLLVQLLVGVLAAAPAAFGQEPPPSAAASSPAAAPQSSNADSQSGDLPVSLDRIRAGLKRQATDSLLKRVEIPPDFRIQILEQQRIDDMLSKLDFKHLNAPAPAGGLYGYDQQQRLFNSVDHPLVQPYAAFSGGELITVAMENLIARYLGGKAISSLTDAERARAERAARQEVEKEIAEYCAARRDRNDLQLCASPATDR
jgi:hypothetical protein